MGELGTVVNSSVFDVFSEEFWRFVQSGGILRLWLQNFYTPFLLLLLIFNISFLPLCLKFVSLLKVQVSIRMALHMLAD